MFAHLIIFSFQALSDHDPVAESNIRVLGRTGSLTAGKGIPLYWTGSGIEFKFSGTEFQIELESDYDYFEPWVAIFVDNVLLLRFQAQKGKVVYPIVRRFDDAHSIKILRETPAIDDSKTSIIITNLLYDGTISSPSSAAAKIEFLGDSITAGEGSLGVPSDNEWISCWFSASSNYAQITARLLNADFRIIAQSGWGVYSSYDNNIHHNIPVIYDYVCGIGSGKGSNNQVSDFESWAPTAIVINLGLNDMGAASYNDEWTDPETGQVYKSTPTLIENAYYDFLVKLRRLNPSSKIVCIFFENQQTMSSIIQNALTKFKSTGDTNNDFFLIPTYEETGARSHPGADSHLKLANSLASQLAKSLGI